MASMLALHVVQPGLSPLNEAVSFYVHGRYGWLLTLGLVALSFGSLAIAIGLGVRRASSFLGVLLMGAWSAAVLLGGVFSTDPSGNWDRPPSISGTIHGVAAMIAFTVFPLATIALVPSFRQDRRWQLLYGTLKALTTAVVVTYVAFMASLAPVFVRPGPPILLGLTERLLLAAYIAWLAVVAVGLLRMGDASRVE